MTDHPTPEATEREAREAVHAITAVGHKMACASVKFIKPDRYSGLDKYGSSGNPCDCGADAKREATLDAYAAAVRRAERERIAIREAMTTHPAAREVTEDMVMIPRSLAHKADGLLSLVGYRHKVRGVGVDAAEFIEASLEFRAALAPDARRIARVRALWVDDSKPEPTGYSVARTYDDAVRMLRRYEWDTLYLDHDLGDDAGRTGYDLLVQMRAEGRVPAWVECISWSPVGKRRILNLWSGIYAERFPLTEAPVHD